MWFDVVGKAIRAGAERSETSCIRATGAGERSTGLNGEREEGNVVFFGKANGSGDSTLSRFESTVEGYKWDFEVDCV